MDETGLTVAPLVDGLAGCRGMAGTPPVAVGGWCRGLNGLSLPIAFITLVFVGIAPPLRASHKKARRAKIKSSESGLNGVVNDERKKRYESHVTLTKHPQKLVKKRVKKFGVKTSDEPISHRTRNGALACAFAAQGFTPFLCRLAAFLPFQAQTGIRRTFKGDFDSVQNALVVLIEKFAIRIKLLLLERLPFLTDSFVVGRANAVGVRVKHLICQVKHLLYWLGNTSVNLAVSRLTFARPLSQWNAQGSTVNIGQIDKDTSRGSNTLLPSSLSLSFST